MVANKNICDDQQIQLMSVIFHKMGFHWNDPAGIYKSPINSGAHPVPVDVVFAAPSECNKTEVFIDLSTMSGLNIG